jgi:hypothetical protein
MAMLFKTTVTDKHWHLIYKDDAARTFVTSNDKGHTHEISLYPDPLTNEPRLAVALAGEKPHTHETEELKAILPAAPSTKDENKVTEEAIGLFKHAVKIEEPSRKKSIEAVDFFKGEHWTQAEKSELNSKSRAHQVYNYTQAFVDSLSGLARQNRLDPRAFPMEGSDDGVADIVTAVLTWIAKRSNLPQQEIRVFEDEVVPGRGLFHINMTQRNNPLGDVVIERFPWSDGYFGAHHELDGSDATHCHKAKWISFQEAQARYPHIKDKLESQIENSHEYPDVDDEVHTFIRMMEADTELYDKAHKRLRFIEHEIKETRIAYFVSAPNGIDAQEVSYEAYRKAETIPNLNLMEFPRDRIRIVVTVGNQLVRNYYPDRPYEGFSLVAVYAYKFDDNDWCGKVESMKDAQREINKRGSQAIDIVNRMLGQGYVYDDETFNDDKDKANFGRNAGKPGSLNKVANADRPPTPLQSPPFPVELLRLHSQNVEIMQAVTNIPPAMAGTGTGYESGSALNTQKVSGMVGNERIFDNFILSKQAVFRKVFRLVQKFYSKERIARLVLSAASDPTRMEAAKIGQREIPIEGRTPDEDQELMRYIMKMLETADLNEYDITIGEQPLSPTAREAQLRLWMEAQNHGMQVPPAMLIDLSSLPNKGKWAREMQAMQQAQMEMERMKFNSEMAKAGRTPVNQTGG